MPPPPLRPNELEIRAGALIARIRPDIGGSVSGFWRIDPHELIDILRPAPVDADSPLQMSSFPLIPFCNRIEHGRFAWNGRNVHIARNDPQFKHPLHGFGWKAAWRATARRDDQIELHWRYTPGEWPWAFEAQQTIFITEDALRIDLRMTNLADEIAPAGLGHHPYYPLHGTTRLHVHAERKCETDQDGMPTQLSPVPGGRVLGERAQPCGQVLDNPFIGWREPAIVEQPDDALRVTITTQPPHPALGVFVPPEQQFFCVEPVQNTPNAINQPQFGASMHALAPNETLRSMMELRVERLEASREA